MPRKISVLAVAVWRKSRDGGNFLNLFFCFLTFRVISHTKIIKNALTHCSFGRRRFAVAGPSTWNSPPDGLCDPELSQHFQTSTENIILRDIDDKTY